MISLLAAVSANGVIGIDGKIPWHNKYDMQWFKLKTSEGIRPTVIMGRKTYDSIGHPLPGRENVVITKTYFAIPHVKVVDSYEEAIDYANNRDSDNISIIGGAQIYNIALQLCSPDFVYLSIIDSIIEGDAFFPWINPLHYKVCAVHDKGIKVVEYSK